MAPKRKQDREQTDSADPAKASTTNEAIKRDTKKAKPNESITGDPSSSTSTSNPANQNDWNPTPGKLPENGEAPVQLLRKEMENHEKSGSPTSEGGNVLYLMGMKSLRIEDNRGIAHASSLAQERKQAGKDGSSSGNLIVLFSISPTEWKMHDRGPRRIDFVLRNLREIKKQLDELNIPLVVYTAPPSRKDLPNKLIELAKKWDVKDIVGNVEYEVDECWRDIAIIKAAADAGLHATFLEDTYVVPAFHLQTKTGTQFAVFSPWNRAWTAHIEKNMDLLDESPLPKANDQSVRTGKLKGLFDDNASGFGIPESVEGFECKDAEYMRKLWPAGSESARKVLSNFVRGKGGESAFEDKASSLSSSEVSPDSKDSRLNRYGIGRNLCAENGTSRLSPYLAAGIISPRACIRATMKVDKNKFKVGRSTGTETWNTEISFRDFYAHVLAAFPRVCMNHFFVQKYEKVKWEYDDELFQAWVEGRTGYPLVDAAMRQAGQQGYMHNRGRMTVASFLSKHLMLDWRKGERWFNQNLIDQDFASNNAGWAWSSSCGVDPQPYFRIFNPTSQSEKCDPKGEYIRHYIPELRSLQGPAVHNPFERLSRGEFEKLGYPKPIVVHKEARERALRRFKEPGSE